MFQKNHDWRESIGSALLRVGLIVLLVLVLLVVSAFPFRMLQLGEIRPAFILVLVYYWSIIRPSVMTPVTAFLIGTALDLLCGYPLGLSAVCFIVVQWVTTAQRKFLLGQSFRVIWAGMAMTALGAGIVQWLVFSLFYGEPMPMVPAIAAVFLTTAVFPLLAPLLSFINKALAEPDAPI